ncbi:hypothetical protein ACHAW5_003716 [Stephanodiscus triporus]|uniref:VPS37 C-terminal domain-containing protein n=1 Tax=Stephanodiscus triporus TaxID=2934178 RepID=A0ABD3NXU7_9STRA
MFWNTNTSPAPARVTPLFISRAAHLSSYLNHPVLKPSTRKLSDDTYDTVFQTTNGFALILRIYLPADVNCTPSMTLHGVRATHTWLDIRMKVIGYPQLASDQSWRASNIKLGDAVHAIIQHFQVNPPVIMEITDSNLKRLQESLTGSNIRPGRSSDNNGGLTNNNQYAPQASASEFQRPNDSMQLGNGHSRPTDISVQNDRIKPKVDFEIDDDEVDGLIPPIPSSFPEFDAMPLSEVKRVVENKAFLDLFVEGTSEVTTLRELKQSIETSNVDAAKANLADEEIIVTLSSEVKTLEQDLSSKIQQYRKLDAERLKLTQPPKVKDVIAELLKAKKDALRESDDLAERWIESGGSDVSDFVKKFIDVRQFYHTRAAKAERLEIDPPEGCQQS